MATAGRTVLFSSLTVAGAIASLIVFPQRFLYSMGIGGSLVALIAAAIALIVLPAVLAVLGERVNSLAPAFLNRRAERDARPAHEGFWYRLSQLVMRFPGRIAAASAALLIALGIPFFSIQFTSVDAQVLPESASARQVDDALRADFPPFRDTPITLAVQGGADQARAVAAPGRRDSTASPRSRPPIELERGVSAVQAISDHPPLSDASQDLVERLRASDGPSLVTGFTADFVDLKESLVDHLPLVLAIAGLVTFVVLFVMTGSVILPLKQILMNALTLSAVFGILVLVFQDGRFESLLGYTSQGGARDDPAAVPVRGRLRALDRLRRLPALADQGGLRRRRLEPRRGRDRARAHRADRDRGGAAVLDRDRRLRHLGHGLHQGARARRRARGADRRDDRPRAAGAVADAAAGPLELVGAAAAAAAARADRAQRGLNPYRTISRRSNRGRRAARNTGHEPLNPSPQDPDPDRDRCGARPQRVWGSNDNTATAASSSRPAARRSARRRSAAHRCSSTRTATPSTPLTRR